MEDSYLIKDDRLIKYFFGFLILFFFLLFIFLIAPVYLYKTVPMAAPSQVKIYMDAAKKAGEGKVDLDWKDVISVDAALLDQNFDNTSFDRVEKLSERFIEEKTIEEEEEYINPITGQKEIRKVEKVIYEKKSINSLISEFINEGLLKEEHREDILNYRSYDLDSLVDVGNDMPDGWSPIEKDFLWPIPGCFIITSKFGPRIDPVEGIDGFHTGVDIGAPFNSPIHAAKDGVVITAKLSGNAGNAVVINHEDGTQTRYYHMNKILVKKGQKVSKGDIIGLEGSTGKSTGPHLHFEIRINGKVVDPLMFFNN